MFNLLGYTFGIYEITKGNSSFPLSNFIINNNGKHTQIAAYNVDI